MCCNGQIVDVFTIFPISVIQATENETGYVRTIRYILLVKYCDLSSKYNNMKIDISLDNAMLGRLVILWLKKKFSWLLVNF